MTLLTLTDALQGMAGAVLGIATGTGLGIALCYAWRRWFAWL